MVSSPSDQRLLDLLERANALGEAATADQIRECAHAIVEASHAHQRRAGEAIVRSWTPAGLAAADSTLLICFAGADANLGGGMSGGMPSHEFVKSCRRAGVTHALFVRDCLRAWYTRGVRVGSSPDDAHCTSGSFEGLVSALRCEIADLRPARVVTIGSSMGGYAAVRAALALNADGAVAFSPQVMLDAARRASVRSELALPEAPFDGLLRTLSALGSATGVPTPSLLECVEAAPRGCRTAIELHAGTAAPGDLYEAWRLAGAVEARAAAEPGVEVSCTLTVHEERDHNLVKEMRDAGELHELLQRVAGVGAIRHCDAMGHNAARSVMRDDFVGF